MLLRIYSVPRIVVIDQVYHAESERLCQYSRDTVNPEFWIGINGHDLCRGATSMSIGKTELKRVCDDPLTLVTAYVERVFNRTSWYGEARKRVQVSDLSWKVLLLGLTHHPKSGDIHNLEQIASECGISPEEANAAWQRAYKALKIGHVEVVL